jgi:hypothetical protein
MRYASKEIMFKLNTAIESAVWISHAGKHNKYRLLGPEIVGC